MYFVKPKKGVTFRSPDIIEFVSSAQGVSSKLVPLHYDKQ